MLFLCFFSCSDKGLTTYNASPTISIQSHGSGAVVPAGEQVFRAQASDPNHRAEELEVRWFDNQVEICAWEQPDSVGESLCTIDLNPGAHEIYAEVRDQEQAGARAEISLQVEAPDIEPEVYDAPIVTLLFPEDNGTYESGSEISFQAFVAYDGPIDSLFMAWSSSLDGPLAVSLDPAGLVAGSLILSDGTHALSLLVSDSQGGVATVLSTVHVQPSNPYPVIDPIVLSPNPIYTNDILSTEVTATDPEGEVVVLTATWKVDGQLISTETTEEGFMSLSLDGVSSFDKNQQISLEVVADDGVSQITEIAELVVSNTAPTQPSLIFWQQDGIEIQSAIEGVDDIQCVVDSPSDDIDGDQVSYTISWEESGAPWQGGLSTTTHGNDTIPSTETLSGQVFTCTVTPNDGDKDGAAAVAEIDVLPPQQFITIDTLNYNGMTYYPLHLDQCTTTIGMCCSPTTTQEQMNAFCQLAGYSTAVNWVVQTISSTNCYCWGGCTNFTWTSNCCSGQDDRNFVTSVDCQ